MACLAERIALIRILNAAKAAADGCTAAISSSGWLLKDISDGNATEIASHAHIVTVTC